MDSYLLGSGTGRRGGGRIWLESNKIEVIGSLKANGEDGNTYGAGGSGGTIVLRAPMIVIDRTSLLSYSLTRRKRGHLGQLRHGKPRLARQEQLEVRRRWWRSDFSPLLCFGMWKPRRDRRVESWKRGNAQARRSVERVSPRNDRRRRDNHAFPANGEQHGDRRFPAGTAKHFHNRG